MVKGEVAPSSRCRFDFLMIVSYWYWETINNIGSNYGYVGEEILLFNELVPYLSWLLSCGLTVLVVLRWHIQHDKIVGERWAALGVD